MSGSVQCSAVLRNETADFLGTREDHVGAIAHHSGRQDRRHTFLRTVVTYIGLEAQIALPEIPRLPIGGGNLIGVAAMVDRADPILGVELLEIGHLAAAHHSALRLARSSAPGRASSRP